MGRKKDPRTKYRQKVRTERFHIERDMQWYERHKEKNYGVQDELEEFTEE